jgi:hypothetical protein
LLEKERCGGIKIGEKERYQRKKDKSVREKDRRERTTGERER